MSLLKKALPFLFAAFFLIATPYAMSDQCQYRVESITRLNEPLRAEIYPECGGKVVGASIDRSKLHASLRNQTDLSVYLSKDSGRLVIKTIGVFQEPAAEVPIKIGVKGGRIAEVLVVLMPILEGRGIKKI